MGKGKRAHECLNSMEPVRKNNLPPRSVSSYIRHVFAGVVCITSTIFPSCHKNDDRLFLFLFQKVQKKDVKKGEKSLSLKYRNEVNT